MLYIILLVVTVHFSYYILLTENNLETRAAARVATAGPFDIKLTRPFYRSHFVPPPPLPHGNSRLPYNNLTLTANSSPILNCIMCHSKFKNKHY